MTLDPRSESDSSPPPRSSSPAGDLSAAFARRLPLVLASVQPELAVVARSVWRDLPQSDVESAVESGVLAGVRAVGYDPDDSCAIKQDALAATTAVAQAAAHVQRQGLPAGSELPGETSALGAVIPVLPGSPGAGASVVSAVLADAIAEEGWRVFLVDTADPARSGLSYATGTEGPVTSGPHQTVRIRFSWRGKALVGRVETTLPVLSPGMVPPPALWAPPGGVGVPQVTVADLSYDAWRLAAQPLSGPGAFLRAARPAPRPVLVVRASRPSLLHAEQVLARLENWSPPGVAVSPAALVVVGADRWPTGVAGAAGRRVSALLDRAVFLPHDRYIAAGGIGPGTTPTRLRAALMPLLRGWNLAPTDPRRSVWSRLFGPGGNR